MCRAAVPGAGLISLSRGAGCQLSLRSRPGAGTGARSRPIAPSKPYRRPGGPGSGRSEAGQREGETCNHFTPMTGAREEEAPEDPWGALDVPAAAAHAAGGWPPAGAGWTPHFSLITDAAWWPCRKA